MNITSIGTKRRSAYTCFVRRIKRDGGGGQWDVNNEGHVWAGAAAATRS